MSENLLTFYALVLVSYRAAAGMHVLRSTECGDGRGLPRSRFVRNRPHWSSAHRAEWSCRREAETRCFYEAGEGFVAMSDENGLNRGGAGNKDSARATFSIESKDKSFRPVLLERRGVSPSPQQGRHNYQVLVVENDEKVQANLSRQLARQGFSVMGASSGRQALAMQSASDLIILDLDLPDLDGLEVCRSVRLAS